eukprot:663409-Pleurochrysis_carterae.AAC.2
MLSLGVPLGHTQTGVLYDVCRLETQHAERESVLLQGALNGEPELRNQVRLAVQVGTTCPQPPNHERARRGSPR